MKHIRYLIFLCLLVTCFACAHHFIPAELLPYQFSRRAVRDGLQSIQVKSLREQIAFLSSDSLEGRETTYPGQKYAAAFLVDQFREIGLVTVDQNNDFRQEIPLVSITTLEDQEAFLLSQNDTITLQHAKDYLISTSDLYTNQRINAPIVYADYGLEIPDYNFNNYDSVDVEDCWVLVWEGMPDIPKATRPKKHQEFQKHATIRMKRKTAANNNAAGLLIAPAISEEKLSADIRGADSMKPIISHPQIASKNHQETNGIPVIYLHQTVSDSLLDLLSTSLGASRSEHERPRIKNPSLTPASLHTEIQTKTEQRTGENIIGLLPGTSLSYSKEYIVISAHYDHLGKRTDKLIYHGADDNASGTAAALAIARAFQNATVKPARSILFALFDAEEYGLYGSKHFIDYPPVSLEKILANINLDMIGRNRMNFIYVIGSDMISEDLHLITKLAAYYVPGLDLDYRYNTRSHPARLYSRTDHYSFTQTGIPALTFFAGFHEDYHQETDIPEKINYIKVKKVSALAFLTVWGVASYPKELSRNDRNKQ